MYDSVFCVVCVFGVTLLMQALCALFHTLLLAFVFVRPPLSLSAQLLENTIKKIGGLLRVGFGQAGANIIANNLASGSDFNPMVAGQVRYAIFGFIYLLNFDDMTEVCEQRSGTVGDSITHPHAHTHARAMQTLEEDVLLFINKISKVVHDVSMSWGGQPNKNMGEVSPSYHPLSLSWRCF